MLSRNITTRNAPYGTLDTPNVRVKIIGGKPVYVLDPQKESSTGNSRSQSQANTTQLTPVTEKPAEFNPNTPTSKKHWGFSSAQQDQYNSHIHVKESDLNPHKVLPPIKHPDGGHSSTTDSRINTQHSGQQKSSAFLPTTPLQLSKKEELHLLDKLHVMLDRNQAPLLKEAYKDMLDKDTAICGFTDYEDLCRSLIHNKIFINPDTLRLVACMFVSPQYPGKVNYEKVVTFLMGGLQGPYKANPSPRKDDRERRLPGVPLRREPHEGMIMPKNQWGGVNLGMTSDLSPRGDNPFQKSPRKQPYTSPREHKEQNMYFNPVTQTKHIPPGQHHHTLDGKLLRMVENQIQNSDFKSENFEKLRIAFSKSDRQYRRTMSRHQIKKLCADERLPLQESVIDQIIDKYCGGVGDGQHHWEPFITFLEKVQPLETGLRIPTSKRPKDYAIKLPEPGPNWPLPEEPDEPVYKQSQQHSPPRSRSPHQEYSSKKFVPISDDPILSKYLNKSDSPPPSDLYHNNNDPSDYLQQYSPRDDALTQIQRDLQRKQEIEDIERKVDKLQSDYDYTKKQYMKQEEEDWFERFFKMAAALYRGDVSQNGILDAKDVLRTVNEYNQVYDLRLSEREIAAALYENSDNRDKVVLEPFIKKLSLHDQ